jgi:MoxR-like ATPase
MNPVAIEIIGESGLGKTTVIMDTAKQLNLDIIKLNLSQLDELGD